MFLGEFLQVTSKASLLAVTHLTVDIIVMASGTDWKTSGSIRANAELSQLASLPRLKVLRIGMCPGLFESRTDRQYLRESIARCYSLTTILLSPDQTIVSHDPQGNISHRSLQELLQSRLNRRAMIRRLVQAVMD